MPRPARLLPWLPPRAAACPAPSPRSRPNRRCIPCPSPPRAEGGTRAFAHARGKVPGVTRRRVGEPVTLRLVPTLPPPVTTGGPWQRRPKRSPTPAWATPAAGAHVRTHARAAHQSGCRRLPRQPGHVGPTREAAREQPAGCVSGRWRVLCAARRSAGARPSRTEKPARPPPRRSLGKQRGPAPVGLLPGSVPPAANRPGRRLQLHRSRDRCK